MSVLANGQHKGDENTRFSDGCPHTNSGKWRWGRKASRDLRCLVPTASGPWLRSRRASRALLCSLIGLHCGRDAVMRKRFRCCRVPQLGSGLFWPLGLGRLKYFGVDLRPRLGWLVGHVPTAGQLCRNACDDSGQARHSQVPQVWTVRAVRVSRDSTGPGAAASPKPPVAVHRGFLLKPIQSLSVIGGRAIVLSFNPNGRFPGVFLFRRF